MTLTPRGGRQFPRNLSISKAPSHLHERSALVTIQGEDNSSVGHYTRDYNSNVVFADLKRHVTVPMTLDHPQCIMAMPGYPGSSWLLTRRKIDSVLLRLLTL